MQTRLFLLTFIPALLSAQASPLNTQEADEYFQILKTVPIDRRWKETHVAVYYIPEKDVTIKHLKFSPFSIFSANASQQLLSQFQALGEDLASCAEDIGLVSDIDYLSHCPNYKTYNEPTTREHFEEFIAAANGFKSDALNEIKSLNMLKFVDSTVASPGVSSGQFANLKSYYIKNDLEYLLVFDKFSDPLSRFDLADNSRLVGQTIDSRLNLYLNMAEAVKAVSEKGVSNCGIHPGSMFFDSRDKVVLTDFSGARIGEPCEGGVDIFTAPEVFDEKHHATTATDTTLADVFSLGAVIIHIENEVYSQFFDSVSMLKHLKEVALHQVSNFSELRNKKLPKILVNKLYSLIEAMVDHVDDRISIHRACEELARIKELYVYWSVEDLLDSENREEWEQEIQPFKLPDLKEGEREVEEEPNRLAQSNKMI